MSRKMSVEEVAEVVENTDLAAAITDGVAPEDIASGPLARKWRKAKALLSEITEILSDEYEGSMDDEDDDEDFDGDDGDDEEPEVNLDDD